MAKRARNVGGAQATFNKILATIPAKAEFEITMNADSTVEVWSDIDTNLDDGEAWLIYGAEYLFENISPTVPAQIMESGNAHNEMRLQVHRNDDSELLLNHNDDDLMFEHHFEHIYTTSGRQGLQVPFRFGTRTITFSEKLRVLFRTNSDWGTLSAATIQLAGCLYYDRIKAPSIGQSKLGQIADL